jgi:hypothetical protein
MKDNAHMHARGVSEALEASSRAAGDIEQAARLDRREDILTLATAFAYAAILWYYDAPTWGLVLALLVVERTRKRRT